jgi:hypothetical protein
MDGAGRWAEGGASGLLRKEEKSGKSKTYQHNLRSGL